MFPFLWAFPSLSLSLSPRSFPLKAAADEVTGSALTSARTAARRCGGGT